MDPNSIIASLDDALAGEGSEDVILRRPYGTGSGQKFVQVTCRAKISALRENQLASGIPQSDLNFIVSVTEINNAQWPGGTVPQLPPFNIDQRVPRASADKIIARGRERAITFVDPKYINEVLVRIDGRMTG